MSLSEVSSSSIVRGFRLLSLTFFLAIESSSLRASAGGPLGATRATVSDLGAAAAAGFSGSVFEALRMSAACKICAGAGVTGGFAASAGFVASAAAGLATGVSPGFATGVSAGFSGVAGFAGSSFLTSSLSPSVSS